MYKRQDPYCAFMAVKDAMNGTSRHSWPDELRRYHVDIFADARFADRARYHAFVQFLSLIHISFISHCVSKTPMPDSSKVKFAHGSTIAAKSSSQ